MLYNIYSDVVVGCHRISRAARTLHHIINNIITGKPEMCVCIDIEKSDEKNTINKHWFDCVREWVARGELHRRLLGRNVLVKLINYADPDWLAEAKYAWGNYMLFRVWDV